MMISIRVAVALIWIFLLSRTKASWRSSTHDGPSALAIDLVRLSSSGKDSDGAQDESTNQSRQLTGLNKYQWKPTGNGKRILVVSFLCDEQWDEVLKEALQNWSKRRRVFRLTLENSTLACREEGANEPKIKFVRNRIAVYPRDRAPNDFNCASAVVSAVGGETNSSVLYTHQSYITLNRQCYQEDFLDSLSEFCWTLGFAGGLATDPRDRKSCMGQRKGKDKPVGRDFKLLRSIYGKKNIFDGL